MLKHLPAAALAAGPAVSMSAFDAAPAPAPARKAGCAANVFDACMKACNARGGQPRFCPDYCNRRKAAKGC